MTRMPWIVIAALLLAPLHAGDLPAPVRVTRISDLSHDAALIRRHGTPMMLEFAAADCPYCDQLEEELLKPMLRNAGYRQRIMIRKIDMSEAGYLRDFDGRRIAVGDFVARYGVDLTPTLLFLDANGDELCNRIIGVQSMDFFGAVVDRAIDESRERLQIADSIR